jgi:hypothetical protein
MPMRDPENPHSPASDPACFEQLRYEQDGPVARITLNRPERHNALSMRLSEELTAALELVGLSQSVKVLVIAGAGGTFCAGDDITEMGLWGDANQIMRRVRGYQRMADSRCRPGQGHRELHRRRRAVEGTARARARLLDRRSQAIGPCGGFLMQISQLPHIGFQVAAAAAGSELALVGRHRFSCYALIFRLEQIGPGRSRLTAETRAAFPGLAGRVYRALVIGTHGHVVVVALLLSAIKRRSEKPTQTLHISAPGVEALTPPGGR